MKDFLSSLKHSFLRNYGSFILIGGCIILLLSYYFIPYNKEIYQVILVITLFIPVIYDLIFKIKKDKIGINYFEESNFTTVRLYLLFIYPLFYMINTRWDLFIHFTKLTNLAFLVIYILFNVLINIFFIKHAEKENRNPNVDHTINLITYLLIAGLFLLLR